MAAPSELLRFGCGSLLALLAGASVLAAARAGPRGSEAWAGFLASSWVLGLTILVPAYLLAGLSGLPLGPATVCLLALLVALVAHVLARGAEAPQPTVEMAWESEPRWLELSARALLVVALALFVWKVLATPLWGWDHFAIWGLKARRLVVEGHLDLGFLAREELLTSRPDYPLGFPLLCRMLALGALPGEASFKAIHLGLGVALLTLLRELLRHLSRRRALADALTAWAACLPLFWDTETVGQAEMPLALWAVAAVALILAPRERRGFVALLPAGLVLGFLPWIKQEGLPLALVLLAALVFASPRGGRRARLAGLLIGGLAWGGIGFLLHARLPAGVSFFSGAVLERISARLPEAPELLGAMARFFFIPDFLGVWPILALAALASVWRRNRLALALLGVVGFEVVLYMAITFAVYLDPESHIEASFARIIAPLTNLGIVALAALAAPRSGGPAPGHVYNQRK